MVNNTIDFAQFKPQVPTKKKEPDSILMEKKKPIAMKIFENGAKSTNWHFGEKRFTKPGEFSFEALEIYVRDARGNEVVAYTIGRYVIEKGQRTNWLVYNTNALYQIMNGDAWVMIAEDGKVLEQTEYVCVPQETRHAILNQSTGVPCKVELIFPGEISIE
jgi:quercetin dioxygenase-like cupin family protein